MGGGENLRTKDIALSCTRARSTFLTMMVLDGVLERHPEAARRQRRARRRLGAASCCGGWTGW